MDKEAPEPRSRSIQYRCVRVLFEKKYLDERI